jgi:hypothetical protein
MDMQLAGAHRSVSELHATVAQQQQQQQQQQLQQQPK